MQWHDEAPSKFVTELLGDLRDEVWRLKYVNGAGIEEEVGAMAEEGDKDRVVMFQEDQLKEKKAQIDAMKYKYMAVVLILMVLLVGVLLGKMSV